MYITLLIMYMNLMWPKAFQSLLIPFIEHRWDSCKKIWKCCHFEIP